jgi:hypothetical protein
MAATKMQVTYKDGRTVEFLVPPRVQIMTEEFFRPDGGVGEINKIKASFYLAWLSLHRSGQESADFEAWIDLIADAAEFVGGQQPDSNGSSPIMTTNDG